MKLLRSLALVLLLAGCGVGPAGPAPAGDAPTGLARGVTLYLLDDNDHLVASLRQTARLGTIADGISLLLDGSNVPGLHSGIAPTTVRWVLVTVEPGVIDLTLPLAYNEVDRNGIDQLVCTALGIHVQSGGDRGTQVRLRFTISRPGSGPEQPRTCPLFK